MHKKKRNKRNKIKKKTTKEKCADAIFCGGGGLFLSTIFADIHSMVIFVASRR